MSDELSAAGLSLAWDVLLQTLGGPAAAPVTDPGGETSSKKIPVTVLSGFLGAGKTTLLCQLLEQAPYPITAIVNDVGSINVDAEMVRRRNADTIEFQNGCACCVLGSDLREALQQLATRPGTPQAVVIEASGIADPMGIAQSVANVVHTHLHGVVTLVDATAMHTHAMDPLAAPLFKRQIAAAHLLVLSKTGLCVTAEEDLRAQLAALAPGRPVLTMDTLFNEMPTHLNAPALEILLGAATAGARPSPPPAQHNREAFTACTLSWQHAVNAPDFFQLLDAIPDSIYRMKGCVQFHHPQNGEQWLQVQATGRRWSTEEVTTATTIEDKLHGPAGYLVIIGQAQADAFKLYTRALNAL